MSLAAARQTRTPRIKTVFHDPSLAWTPHSPKAPARLKALSFRLRPKLVGSPASASSGSKWMHSKRRARLGRKTQEGWGANALWCQLLGGSAGRPVLCATRVRYLRCCQNATPPRPDWRRNKSKCCYGRWLRCVAGKHSGRWPSTAAPAAVRGSARVARRRNWALFGTITT